MSRAGDRLERLRGLPAARARLPEIERLVADAGDPDALVVGLQRLYETGADPGPHLAGWMRLLDASPIAVDPLVARPALLREIPERGGTWARGQLERDLAEQLSLLPHLDARLDHLREVRVDETLRIAWHDVVEGADLTVVTRRISELAEILLEHVLQEVQHELAARYGRPWHEAEPVSVAVIAMGKLGGAELNYSSDIDLVFLYGKDGETDGGANGKRISNREYFHRLTERVTREVDAVTPCGRLYRVDLRLRPEGAVGSLARSLASSLAYYGRMGETWERQALLKARVIAGDRALGRQFVESIRDWVFGRGLRFEEIAALKRIKERIEARTQTQGAEYTEVKLGYGGIRDVEYVIQFLQLLHGARHPEVRHHNSLVALRLLEGCHAILPPERNALDDAYRFLRLVEHRLQLVQHAQVHRIPDDPAALQVLARRCGFPGSDAFLARYRELSEGVRTIFNRLFRQLFEKRDAEQEAETDLLLAADPDPLRVAEVLARHQVREPERGARLVAELTTETSSWLAGSPRTRKFFANLFPRLLDAIARAPDPDAALKRIEAITARVGARATLYEAMGADPRLLQLLVDITGSSAFLSRILVRVPDALEQLFEAVRTEPDRGLASFEDIPTATVPTSHEPARILSDYKGLEVLRIGLRDVRGEQGVRATAQDLTRLAEVIVRLAYERARREARTAGAALVVVALGKFGAGELLFGSDLDLVFFAPDAGDRDGATAIARRLNALLGSPGPFGKLYDVDLRLRPLGTSGPLVTTPAGFRSYFERGLGQTWERMSWTRARAVAGPPRLCEEILASVAETVHAPGFTADDARAMEEMRGRLARAGGPDSLKRARGGGMVDVEFVAQMLALRHGREHAAFRTGHVPALLEIAPREGVLRPQRAADLLMAYEFLMTLESKIRIVTDLPEDRLPEDPVALRSLARRTGYVDTGAMTAEDTLREEFGYHRDVAARAFTDTIADLAS